MKNTLNKIQPSTNGTYSFDDYRNYLRNSCSGLFQTTMIGLLCYVEFNSPRNAVLEIEVEYIDDERIVYYYLRANLVGLVVVEQNLDNNDLIIREVAKYDIIEK